MVDEIEGVLQRPLVDDEGTPLVRDQEPKYIAEQAQRFKLDAIDIRSPQRKADVEKVHKTHWPAVEAGASTIATAS